MTDQNIPEWVQESAESAPDAIDAEAITPDQDREMNREPTHPGVYLQRALDQSEYEVKDIADITGVSKQTFYKILAEEWRISTELAVKLSFVFEPPARFWVSKSMNHELEEMKKAMNGEADAIRKRINEHEENDEPATA